MHLLIATVALIAVIGLWYLKGRLRFNRSNGRPSETYRSFNHKLIATAVDRALTFAIWACFLVGLLLLR